MSLKNIFHYAKQFSTSLNAGLPVNRVLETLARTAPTKRLRTTSVEVNRSIGSGSTLSQAFEKHGRILPDFFTKMISVGESTGRLEDVTSSLSSYYEQRYAIARAVRGELYPIVFYLGFLMLLILSIEWLTGGAAALEGYADTTAWGLLAAMAVWATYHFSRGFRDALGSLLLHFPLVNRLVRKLCLSKFCEGMKLASESGLDIGTAIRLSAEASGNAAFRKRTQGALEHIEKGSSISEAMERTGVFPFEAIQMFTVGEETGKLHEAMGHVSKLAREEALQTLRVTMVLGVRAIYTLGILYCAYRVLRFWAAYYHGILGGF